MELYKNLILVDLPNEKWIDVIGYDGIYEVSNMGRVKSIGRYVKGSKGGEQWIKTKILKQHVSKANQCTVKLSVDNIKKTHNVQNLVGNAFLRSKKENEEFCHLNKIKTDNRLENIEVKTKSKSRVISYEKGNNKDWGIGEYKTSIKTNYENKKGVYKNKILVSKECNCCKKQVELINFYGKKGRICKDCSLKKHNKIKEVGKQRERDLLAKKGFRYCSICKEKKLLNADFNNSKNSYMGKSNNCKSCTKILNEKYRNRAKKVEKK